MGTWKRVNSKKFPRTWLQWIKGVLNDCRRCGSAHQQADERLMKIRRISIDDGIGFSLKILSFFDLKTGVLVNLLSFARDKT